MATITLYQMNKKINPTNNTLLNFVNIEADKSAWLGNLLAIPTQETRNADLSPQWVKDIHNLKSTITIYLEGRNPLNEYNYMEVIQDNFSHFYFIIGYKELGRNQVQYELVKDTLNTYAADATLGVNIETSNALVLREHKNRFSAVDGSENATPIYHKFIEDIDLIPKEASLINTISSTSRSILSLKQIGGKIVSNNILSVPKFFWEYYQKTSTAISDYISTFNLEAGWGFKIKTTANIQIFGNGLKLNLTNLSDDHIIFFTQIGPLMAITSASSAVRQAPTYTVVEGSISVIADHLIIETFEAENLTSLKVVVNENYELFYNLGATDNDFAWANRTKLGANTGKFSNSTLNLDKSNIKTVKIIELPYPIKKEAFTAGNSSTSYIEILNKIEFDISLNLAVSSPFNFKYLNNPSQLRVKYNDPKLYTGQFMPYMVTFFAEAIPIFQENMLGANLRFNHALNDSDYSKLRVDINQSDYLESKPYECSRTIDMNNEIATYSNDLEEYVKKLYANDLKLLQLQAAQADRNLTKQALNIPTQMVMGAGAGLLAGGGNPLGAIAGVSTGLVKGLIDFGFASAQARDDAKRRDIEFQNKLLNLQSNMINIVGSTPEMHHSGDTDLFKLWHIKPTITDIDYLDNYFYKYGYQTLEIKTINKRTRTWFDYKKLVFEDLNYTKNLPFEVLEDIKRRFAEGVTIFHYQSGGFHFAMNSENKEVTL